MMACFNENMVTVIADDEEAAKKIFEEIVRIAAEHTAENVSYDIDSIERVWRKE